MLNFKHQSVGYFNMKLLKVNSPSAIFRARPFSSRVFFKRLADCNKLRSSSVQINVKLFQMFCNCKDLNFLPTQFFLQGNVIKILHWTGWYWSSNHHPETKNIGVGVHFEIRTRTKICKTGAQVSKRHKVWRSWRCCTEN